MISLGQLAPLSSKRNRRALPCTHSSYGRHLQHRSLVATSSIPLQRCIVRMKRTDWRLVAQVYTHLSSGKKEGNNYGNSRRNYGLLARILRDPQMDSRALCHRVRLIWAPDTS